MVVPDTLVENYPVETEAVIAKKDALTSSLLKLAGKQLNANFPLIMNQIDNLAYPDSYPIPHEFAVSEEFKGITHDLTEIEDDNIFSERIRQIATHLVANQEKVASIITEEVETKLEVVDIYNVSDSNSPISEIFKGKVKSVKVLSPHVNPALTVKLAMGKSMLEGKLARMKEGESIQFLVESSSGNTAVSLALLARTKGIKPVFIIPRGIQPDKISRLTDLGADIVLVNGRGKYDEARSNLTQSLNDKLRSDSANNGKIAWEVNQYANFDNATGHEAVTAKAIAEQAPNTTKIVATVGTGGTVGGLNGYEVIGVEPWPSVFGHTKKGDDYQDIPPAYVEGGIDSILEGFGRRKNAKDLVNVDLEKISKMLKVSDPDGVSGVLLNLLAGFPGGISTGATMAGLLQAIDRGFVTPDDEVVLIAPDMIYAYVDRIKQLIANMGLENRFKSALLEP